MGLWKSLINVWSERKGFGERKLDLLMQTNGRRQVRGDVNFSV
ncbi:MAG: hypothetical protein ACTS4U_01545 [Candidatus Hodgkinia cicadicola]